MAKVQPIPEGYHSITSYLVVSDAAKAIDFYQRAFGAEERFRMPGPGGAIVHAEIQIGDSMVMLCDENPAWGNRSPTSYGGTPASQMMYLADVDQAFARAIAAGAKELMPVADQFWGDRMGKLVDPFGHEWSLASHIEDVPPEQMAARAAKAFSGG